MPGKKELITDDELCALLGISSDTLRRHMRDGPPRERHGNAGDVRQIRNIMVGASRRWVKKSVDEFIHGE